MRKFVHGKFVYIWVFLLGFSTFACQVLPLSDFNPTKVEDTSLSQKSEVFTLLDYFRHLDTLSESELNEEHTRLELWFSKEHQLLDRLKLAVLLSRPNTAYQDYDRSLDLLTEYSQDPARDDRLLRELSFFLSYFIHRTKTGAEEREELLRRLDQLGKQNEKLEAELNRAGEREKSLEDKIKQLRKKSKRLKRDTLKQAKERKKLQKMIDGLKAIEKNLMKQDQALPGSTGDIKK